MWMHHLPTALEVWQDRQIELFGGCFMIAVAILGLATLSYQMLLQLRRESIADFDPYQGWNDYPHRDL